MKPARERFAEALRGKGLEIGALDRPAPVSREAHVTYADILSAEEIADRFPSAPRPSFHTNGERLAGIPNESFDFLIANHVLEHLTDPLGALREWHRVLVPGGRLLLTLPDKRYTFDRRRKRTSLRHLVEDSRSTEPPAIRDREHLLEWATFVEGLAPGSPEWTRFVDAQLAGSFTVHNHVWVIQDLLEIVAHLQRDGSAPFVLERWANTALRGDEFVLLLRTAKSPSGTSGRLALARAVTFLQNPFQMAQAALKTLVRR